MIRTLRGKQQEEEGIEGSEVFLGKKLLKLPKLGEVTEEENLTAFFLRRWEVVNGEDGKNTGGRVCEVFSWFLVLASVKKHLS